MIVLGSQHPKVSFLLKEATAYKKTNLNYSIECIKEALNFYSEELFSSKIPIIKKLADYQRLNGNFDGSLQILKQSYREAFDGKLHSHRAMNMCQIIYYFGTLLKKEKQNTSFFDRMGMYLYCLSMATQGRLIGSLDEGRISETEVELNLTPHNLNDLLVIDDLISNFDYSMDDEIWESYLEQAFYPSELPFIKIKGLKAKFCEICTDININIEAEFSRLM